LKKKKRQWLAMRKAISAQKKKSKWSRYRFKEKKMRERREKAVSRGKDRHVAPRRTSRVEGGKKKGTNLLQGGKKNKKKKICQEGDEVEALRPPASRENGGLKQKKAFRSRPASW